MKIERTKNSTRNIVAGTVQKIVQIILPFLMRTAMIYYMGVQYLGLSSLFSAILQVLNLAELGVGSAMLFSMYKPIAEDDSKTICALMRLYRTYYRIIGLFIAVVGVALTPFIPNLVEGDVPEELSIYTLYLLYLAATVLSYWLFAYKSCLLNAHQRNDVVSVVTTLTTVVQYAIQIFVILVTKDYYQYVLAILGTQILNNVVTAAVATRMYPEYAPAGKLGKSETRVINGRIRDLFTGKLGMVVSNSAGTLIISSFLGLTALAIYQNYYFIITAVIGFVEVILASIMAGLGNSFQTEDMDKNFRDLKKISFLFYWITGFCTCCFLCVFQPFMTVWVGESLMLDMAAVICFCVYFHVYETNRLLNTYKDAAGLWHEDRFRPLTTAFGIIILGILLVNSIGINGVLVGTVLSMVVIGLPWLLHNMFTIVFPRGYLKDYLGSVGLYCLVTAISAVICYLVCSAVQLGEWGNLVFSLVVCAIVPNLIFFVVYRGTKEFGDSISLVDRMTRGRLFKLFPRLANR